MRIQRPRLLDGFMNLNVPANSQGLHVQGNSLFNFENPVSSKENILYGNHVLGYYSTESQFLSANQIRTASRLFRGTFHDYPWLKLSINNRVTYISLGPCIKDVSYNDMDTAGLLRGKIVDIDGVKYRVYTQSISQRSDVVGLINRFDLEQFTGWVITNDELISSYALMVSGMSLNGSRWSASTRYRSTGWQPVFERQ